MNALVGGALALCLAKIRCSKGYKYLELQLLVFGIVGMGKGHREVRVERWLMGLTLKVGAADKLC